jgi:hypothetical protein
MSNIQPIYIYIKESIANINECCFIILTAYTFNNPKAFDYKFQVLNISEFRIIFISESVVNYDNMFFWTKSFSLPNRYLNNKRLITFDELLLVIKDVYNSFHYNKHTLIELLQLVLAKWDEWY